MVEAAAGHAPAAAKPETTAKAPAPAAQTKQQAAAPKVAAPKAAAPKTGADPNRQLFKRSTYAGVKDTGPIPGESFADKVARLKAVAAGAKQRAEEGGGVHEVSAEPVAAVEVTPEPAGVVETSTTTAAEVPAAAPTSQAAPKPTGQADRSLMKRSTYCGVADTGPVAGESFEQKVERLRKVAAAAKQRAEGG
jgi:hypothetical protein